MSTTSTTTSTTTMLRSSRRSRSRKGAAAIEFALWLPVLLLFISAVVDWGYYMTTRAVISRGVMEGTRSGVTVFEQPTDLPEGSKIENRAATRTSLILTQLGIPCPNGANCTMLVKFCEGGGGVNPCGGPPFDALMVDVDYQFQPFFGFIPIPANIHERFVMATEQQR